FAFAQCLRERGPKRGLTIVDERCAISKQETVLAAYGAPDQRAVQRIELLDAVRCFDYFGARETQAAFLGHHDARATSGGDAHAAEAAKLSANRSHDRNSADARRADRANHLGYRDQAGIGLLQPHAA